MADLYAGARSGGERAEANGEPTLPHAVLFLAVPSPPAVGKLN